MKRLLTLLVWCCLISPGLARQMTAKLTFQPARPKPGELIKLTYDPQGTLPADAGDLQGLVYMIKPGGRPFPLSLKRQGTVWTGELTPHDSTSLMLFTFGEGKGQDNNNGKGYALYTYTPQGKPVAGARGWLGFYYGLEKTEAVSEDAGKAVSLFEEEFKAYPGSKADFLAYYLTVLKKERPGQYEAKASALLESMAASKNLTVKQLKQLVAGYEELKKPGEAGKYKAMLRQKDPRGSLVQEERIRQFYDEQDAEKKAVLFNQFKKDFPANGRINFLHLAMANAYRQNGRFADLRKFVQENDAYFGADDHNFLARALNESDQELELAETIAATAVRKARLQLEKAQEAEGLLATALNTYGAILAKNGKPEEAHTHLKESVSLTKGKNAEVNERYVAAMVKTGRHQEALNEAGTFIADGKGTAPMKENLRLAYLAVNGNEKGFSHHLASLETTARENRKKELRTKMISEPAPAFTLLDLNGKTVSMADLKGKTVVLDFWATWCGPCVSSMPGMQQAVNKYKENPDVKFLFINSWQKEADKQKVAGGFLEKKNYDFTVPLDVEDKVISAYKVEGIPTKFIIDPQGNIRFRSVGFSPGGNDVLVEELSMMIDLASGKEL